MANQKKVKVQGFKFQPFSQKQMKVLTCWQDNSPVKDKFLVIADGSIRSGKEQPLSAKLYTPNGYKLMGDIKVGDYVFDRVGKKTKVLGVFPQGKKEIYELIFDDGSTTRCGKEHLWTYFSKDMKLVTKSMSDIMDSDYQNYKFPMNGCVEYEVQEIDLDPYIYGMVVCPTVIEPQIHKLVWLDDDFKMHEYDLPENDYDYTAIRDKGILGKYKYNTMGIRYSVLAGIINIDGDIKDEQSISILCFSNIANDVVELARSLGLYVIAHREDSYDIWKITIKVTKELLVYLPDRFKNMCPSDEQQFRRLVSIKSVGEEECQCIYVDNEEHLYLTDDFIVTHNTVCMALSFVLFVMTHFNQQNAAMCGE